MMASSLERVEVTIRQIAAVSERVFITKHAEKRMFERQVTLTQVLNCLRTGVFIEGSEPHYCDYCHLGKDLQYKDLKLSKA